MSKLDVSVRAPTGTAWLVSAALFILSGEAIFELRKAETSRPFNIPLADSELLALAILFGIGAVVGIAWLISLYVAPGRLVLDPVNATLLREVRKRIHRDRVEAPLSAWSARLLYFSDQHRDKGLFKRIELQGPGLHEVLLFNDFHDGEQVSRALEAVGDKLGSFEARVGSRSSPSAGSG